MTDIIFKENDNILIKDCLDFVPLDDGTKTGDKKYCNLSLICKQVGYYSEYITLVDKGGEMFVRDYLCTGKKVKKEEVLKDEEAK
jgi:hypothetical protein